MYCADEFSPKREPVRTTATSLDPGEETEIHRAVSDDGTEIAGRVHGRGPPLVLVHGGLSDGERGWDSLLPLLTDSFTCYPMSTRGRGLSAEPSDADFSLNRLVEDVVVFAESVGEPVGLVGYSLGGMLALGAAAHTLAVSAVAVYEPAVFEAFSVEEEDTERFAERAERMDEAVAEGRFADAARATIEDAVTGDELSALSASGVFEAWAPNVGVALQEQQQAMQSEAPSPTDPSALARITVPVLCLHGSRTPTPWYTEAARYLGDHVGDLHVVEVAGAGHVGPHLTPESIAHELVRFFE